jgi:hypothetical protein
MTAGADTGNPQHSWTSYLAWLSVATASPKEQRHLFSPLDDSDFLHLKQVAYRCYPGLY